MNFDGITLSCVAGELRGKILEGVIRKIYQPEKDLLLINIWANEDLKLLISISSEPRVYLTDQKFRNPQKPPAFCMLLRARLGGGIIRKVKQRGLDRVLDIHVQKKGKKFILSLELMGRYSNCILIENNQVVDSLKRRKGKRTILPKASYQPPPPQDKYHPLSLARDKFKEMLNKNKNQGKELWRIIQANIDGIGPPMAKEIPIRAGISPSQKLFRLTSERLNSLAGAFEEIFSKLRDKQWNPRVYYEDGRPVSWAPFELATYAGMRVKEKATICGTLDEYYQYHREEEKFNKYSEKLFKAVEKGTEKVKKALSSVQDELEKSKKYDKYRKKADLLMANQAHIKKPGKQVKLEDIFEDGEKLITIDLDPSLSVIENANKYYQKYKKLKRAQSKLTARISELAREKRYLLEVESNLKQAESLADLKVLEEELKEEGYISTEQRSESEKVDETSGPRKFRIGAYLVLVGKSGRQNDKLVRNASKRDVWFHVKNLPGAHVILKTGEDPEKIPPEILYKASQLAAYYSKARGSTHVPVTHTPVKYLKKPKGAKPGLVIVEKEDVITVTLNDFNLRELLA